MKFTHLRIPRTRLPLLPHAKPNSNRSRSRPPWPARRRSSTAPAPRESSLLRHTPIGLLFASRERFSLNFLLLLLASCSKIFIGGLSKDTSMGTCGGTFTLPFRVSPCSFCRLFSRISLGLRVLAQIWSLVACN